MDINNFELRFITSISEVSSDDWDDLPSNQSPFLMHSFLRAFEDSHSVSKQTGWQPYHLVALSSNKLVGAIPLYLKSHSYGEYVFDFQWAEAYQRAGGLYYPKMLAAIPFTPCSDPRVLISKAAENGLIQLMIDAIQVEAKRLNSSSFHLLFPDNPEQLELQTLGLLKRQGIQYHWFNREYHSFDDFLGALKAKPRKNIRRERRQVVQSGCCFKVLEGANISNDDWQQFYRFYVSTYRKRSGSEGYLNEDFFKQIGKEIPNSIVLIGAFNNEQMIAASLFFKNDYRLYGRYWGCLKEYDYLHFETCYYQGIEYCIQNGLKHFDAGAQGEHKIKRGFIPVKTFSFHWLQNSSFQDAVREFLVEEAVYVNQVVESLTERSPYKG